MIVVDTNVLSELMRGVPSAAVLTWIGTQPAEQLYTTSVTVAEIGYGISRLPVGGRKERLRAAAEDVFISFADHVLPFDVGAAVTHAAVVVQRERLGDPISAFDAQVAAICLSRGAQLATRNLRDFRSLDLNVVDPWQIQPG